MPIQLDGLITRADIADIAARDNLLFEDQERYSILESMHTIDVQACPGSGKTTLIATKLILLAGRWPLQHQGLCVLSHTNVAKNEIIDRINKSKIAGAQRLLSYPHFIGTIQEFVNRFLALPYLRSKGISHISVDNDEYVNAARKMLARNQFTWFRGTLRGLGTQDGQDGFLRGTFRYCSDTGNDITINKIPKGWRNPESLERAKRDLLRLKDLLDQRGFFLYRDMYTHAQHALLQNDSLRQSVSERFPFVLIDEMQDTQKFQDSLLCSLFPLDEPKNIVQRFGDPDQAIFSNMNGEDSNETYNRKTAENMDFVINRSHRFGNDISFKIKNFSFNCVDLESELAEEAVTHRITQACNGAGFNHCIIIFDDDNVGQVVPAYADLVAQQFSQRHKISPKFCAKIVGAVGNEIEPNGTQLKIGHYWREYDRTKAPRNFKESSLIDAVRFCSRSSSPDWASNYAFLKSCILKLLKIAEIVDDEGTNFKATTLRTYLKDNGKWGLYRKTMHTLLCNGLFDRDSWGRVRDELSVIFDLNPLSPEAAAYLAFVDEDAVEEPEAIAAEVGLISIDDNFIRHPEGFSIEISTIHGVKGETHDATLVLETKHHCFDLETMVPYLAQTLPSLETPNIILREAPSAAARFKPNQKFMRQLYVAMSRPKYLLCLAIHRNRITPEERIALERLGWTILQLPIGDVAEAG